MDFYNYYNKTIQKSLDVLENERHKKNAQLKTVNFFRAVVPVFIFVMIFLAIIGIIPEIKLLFIIIVASTLFVTVTNKTNIARELYQRNTSAILLLKIFNFFGKGKILTKKSFHKNESIIRIVSNLGKNEKGLIFNNTNCIKGHVEESKVEIITAKKETALAHEAVEIEIADSKLDKISTQIFNKLFSFFKKREYEYYLSCSIENSNIDNIKAVIITKKNDIDKLKTNDSKLIKIKPEHAEFCRQFHTYTTSIERIQEFITSEIINELLEMKSRIVGDFAIVLNNQNVHIIYISDYERFAWELDDTYDNQAKFADIANYLQWAFKINSSFKKIKSTNTTS